MSFKPLGKMSQKQFVLNHLIKKGSISALEALGIYGCYRLQARINDLRVEGYSIDTEYHKDHLGRKYARYVMEYTSKAPTKAPFVITFAWRD